MTATADWLRIQQFLTHEATLLDERRFEDWRDLFAEDGLYWVPLRPDQENPDDEVSLFCDDRATMEVRINRLRHPRIHAQTPPSRTCHVIGNVTIEARHDAARELTVASTMVMTEFRKGEQRLFSGRVQHRLRETDQGLSIVLKKVVLTNCDDIFELIAVPF